EGLKEIEDEFYNPMQFSYVSVRPDSFGFSEDEILHLDDDELKSVVSIKKLAPFREDGGRDKATQLKIRKWRLTREKKRGPYTRPRRRSPEGEEENPRKPRTREERPPRRVTQLTASGEKESEERASIKQRREREERS
ncbi:KRR1 interacting protein 1 like protein, partial [Aduncisulcus paluster]